MIGDLKMILEKIEPIQMDEDIKLPFLETKVSLLDFKI